MAQGTVNKVILVGRLGQDPEIKYTQSGRAMANISIATNEAWKDQQGQKQERTDWHRCTAWGRLAEVMGEYLQKGSKVYLEGRLQTRSYEDNDGAKRYITEVVVQNMEMLGSKGDQSNAGTAPGRAATPPAPEPEEDDLPF